MKWTKEKIRKLKKFCKEQPLRRCGDACEERENCNEVHDRTGHAICWLDEDDIEFLTKGNNNK